MAKRAAWVVSQLCCKKLERHALHGVTWALEKVLMLSRQDTFLFGQGSDFDYKNQSSFLRMFWIFLDGYWLRCCQCILWTLWRWRLLCLDGPFRGSDNIVCILVYNLFAFFDFGAYVFGWCIFAKSFWDHWQKHFRIIITSKVIMILVFICSRCQTVCKATTSYKDSGVAQPNAQLRENVQPGLQDFMGYVLLGDACLVWYLFWIP